MSEFEITAAAQQDLEDMQWEGLERFGAHAARRHVEGFDRIFGLLIRHPSAGEACAEHGEGMRVFSHNPHRIFCRVDPGHVLIIRVLHAAQDVAPFLRN